MAIPKVCGTETEFGIRYAGPGDLNPTSASSIKKKKKKKKEKEKKK
jgi:hypothetical protein